MKPLDLGRKVRDECLLLDCEVEGIPQIELGVDTRRDEMVEETLRRGTQRMTLQ
jgi:hypothetical protein